MLLSPFPGVNWSSSPPSFESLPAYGRIWSVQRGTYSSQSSTQQYLIFKSYVPKNDLPSSANDIVQLLTQSLIDDSKISVQEALSVTQRLDRSAGFPGHRLLTVQYHTSAGCPECASGSH